jgi:hypothetical protein
MAAYCGRCGRRMFGDEWFAWRGPHGDFFHEVVESVARSDGEPEIGLCEGGHWYAWMTSADGVLRTARLPYRFETPTRDEVLAALGGEEATKRGRA